MEEEERWPLAGIVLQDMAGSEQQYVVGVAQQGLQGVLQLMAQTWICWEKTGLFEEDADKLIVQADQVDEVAVFD